MFLYKAFNRSLASDIFLPGFQEHVACSANTAITRAAIREAVSCHPSKVIAIRNSIGIESIFPNKTKCISIGGREIVLQSSESIQPDYERQPLYGFALAALLHQMGLLVLHTNTVVKDGKAFIIAGGKRFGKSTLAAALIANGYQLLSDDVSALSIQNKNAVALPGVPILKLWPDAIEKSGITFMHLEPLYSHTKKCLCIPFADAICQKETDIAAVIILEAGAEAPKIEFVENKKKRFLLLASCHYFASYQQLLSKTERQQVFEMFTILSKDSCVIRLLRPPNDPDTLSACVKLLEKALSRSSNPRISIHQSTKKTG